METSLVYANGAVALTNSILVAKKFEKDHQHILRDIRNLMEGVSKIGDTPMFEETSYIHPQNGQEYPMFVMNRDGFTLLAMGFTGDKALRFKLEYIKAFNVMEKTIKEPHNLLHDKMIAAKWAADFLNLNEVSKLLMAKHILDPLGLPTPDYVPSKGVKHSAKELLARNGIQMSAQSLNKALAKAGILKQHTRLGKGGKVHKWYVITDIGERFGENGICPQSPNQTQPLWYDDMFSELVATAKRATA